MEKKLFFATGFLVLSFIMSSCSNEPSDYLGNGVKEFESGNYGSAIANLRRAKYLMPESFKANFYLGRWFLKNPKAKDSAYKARHYLNVAKDLAKTGDERFNVSFSLLSIYERQEDYSKINKECKYLIEKNKKLLDRKRAYALYTTFANSYFNMDEYREAAKWYECIIDNYSAELAKNPEFRATAYNQFGAAVIKADKERFADGISYTHKAEYIEKEVFSNHYKVSAAKCYAIIGDYYFQEKKAYKKSMRYYQKAGTYYEFLNDSEKADDISEKFENATVELDKRCEEYDCLMRKGKKELEKMDYDDAAGYFKRAEQKGKTNHEKAEAITKAGFAYYLDGEYEEALAQLKILSNKYEKQYNNSTEKSRVDLFMGASLILTTKSPSYLSRKVTENFVKVSGFFSKDTDEDKPKIETFEGNIESGKRLIEFSLGSINEKTQSKYVLEAARVCERIGDRLEQYKRKEEAKEFYEKATSYYGKQFENEKVFALKKTIRNLN